MRLDSQALKLYAITDRTWLDGRTLLEVVEETIIGGATFVQLREKNLNDDEFLKEAIEIGKLCKEYKVSYVVNDNISIALESKANGVHLGQSDLVPGIREIIGDEMILGISASNLKQALLAQKLGADYLGVGAVFPTTTKDNANSANIAVLREICQAVDIPVVAIGGINETNADQLKGTGIAGISVISSIFAKSNIRLATEILRDKIKEVL